MAKILLAFFNCLKGENEVPMFYQTFMEGLDNRGHHLLVYSHKHFF